MNNENITEESVLSFIAVALSLPIVALMIHDIILIYIFDGEIEIFGRTLGLLITEPIAECE